MSEFDELFGSHRVMVILRGLSSSQAVAAACRAWDAGVQLLEVPIGAAEQVAALAAVVAAGNERGKVVGAGTVVAVQQIQAAVDAGASYTVAPGFDPDVLAESLAAGMPHLPGVATPTEVQHARNAGCRWVKVFPAGIVGPAWFRAINGPFPDMRYVATGGINIPAAKDFLAAGAQVVAFGSAATDPAMSDELMDLISTMHPA
ncbi:MAG TPA: bifunctional 4-hydroxy-2-oxoglutarate aldolase/2-dehydro-3-deoxy-phosphogluconate aldolase [Candidatus Limnocylindrales bacterium]|nr:bifunctional 4-hydroxy-2-oxoglutarate aldolase/2-dehydro-3-deoxy-phosphogluconate aldolase [Candidatus Limnocylindrales bacterium]